MGVISTCKWAGVLLECWPAWPAVAAVLLLLVVWGVEGKVTRTEQLAVQRRVASSWRSFCIRLSAMEDLAGDLLLLWRSDWHNIDEMVLWCRGRKTL